MRVLLAPIETAGVANALRAGLRDRGHDADLVVFAPHRFGQPHDRLADSMPARAREGMRAPLRYDVLHWQFGTTLCEFVDAAWGHVAGRPLQVMHYWGDDTRVRAVAERLHPARAALMDTHPDWNEPVVLRRHRLAARFCHAALVMDLELASYCREFHRTVYVLPAPLVIPDDPVPAEPPPGEGPVVLHAPSDSAIKGTREIVATMEALAARGVLRQRMLTGVPHDRVLAEIAAADVVVDQLNSETTGVFALEALALGKPVLCQFRRDALAPFARDTPILPVTAATLEAELEALCGDRERRERLGREGREFVRRVHDHHRVAAATEQVYAHARTAPAGVFEATPDGISPLT